MLSEAAKQRICEEFLEQYLHQSVTPQCMIALIEMVLEARAADAPIISENCL